VAWENKGPVSSINGSKEKGKTKVAMKWRDGSTRLDVTRHLRLRAVVSLGPRFNLVKQQKDALHLLVSKQINNYTWELLSAFSNLSDAYEDIFLDKENKSGFISYNQDNQPFITVSK
jgi:hypothetical protein